MGFMQNLVNALTGKAKTLDDVYQESYARILDYDDTHKDFFDIFYRNFMMSSPQIQEKFRNTDMRKQVSLLKNFLTHMQAYYITGEANEHLRRLAVLHGKSGHNITAEMYDLWKRALFDTLKACDPKWSQRVEQAWDQVLTPGIQFMCSQYD